MTVVFVWVILAVTDARNEHPALAPLAIGLALTMIHFASINATGTSVNPARSIGVGALRRHRRDHPALALHPGPAARRRARRPGLPVLFGQAATRFPAPGWASGARPPAAVPGYGAPDQYQQQWNQPDAQPQQPQHAVNRTSRQWNQAQQSPTGQAGRRAAGPQQAAAAPPAAAAQSRQSRRPAGPQQGPAAEPSPQRRRHDQTAGPPRQASTSAAVVGRRLRPSLAQVPRLSRLEAVRDALLDAGRRRGA